MDCSTPTIMENMTDKQFNTYGIIAAMDKELDLIKEEIKFEDSVVVSGMTFYMSHINDKNIVFVKCGVGKINAAICTELLIDRFKVDCVINTGVAGALNNDLDIGDIVISKSAVMHDMDVTGLGYKIGQTPGLDVVEFEANNDLVKCIENVIDKLNLNIKYIVGGVASGDQFVSSKIDKERILKYFDVDCVEMEGASIAQVCYINSIPFVIIRSMSDKADDSGHVDYKTFSDNSAKNSAKIVVNFIKSK